MGGGYLGHEMGGGALGTIGGLVAGAWGARELERRHERYDIPFLPYNSFPLFVGFWFGGGGLGG